MSRLLSVPLPWVQGSVSSAVGPVVSVLCRGSRGQCPLPWIQGSVSSAVDPGVSVQGSVSSAVGPGVSVLCRGFRGQYPLPWVQGQWEYLTKENPGFCGFLSLSKAYIKFTPAYQDEAIFSQCLEADRSITLTMEIQEPLGFINILNGHMQIVA